MGHPLASFPIASTGDTEVAQSILSRELADLRFRKVRDRRSFRLEMNGIHLGRTMLGYNRFDADTLVDPGEIDGAVLFVVGVGRPSVFEIDGEPVVCTERGAILSPSRRVVIHRPAGSGIFILRAAFDAIEQRFREVLGRRAAKPLAFDRSVDLASGKGAQTRRLLGFLADSVQRDPTVLDNPLLRVGFDDMLLGALLELPGNYGGELTSDRPLCLPPGIVRRAEEFLHANAAKPITISDVIAECRCSRKALFDAFRSYRAYTPMQFLVDTRLTLAREALQSPSPTDNVTSIAYACGFFHLGRFSQAYRRRFGESPSETLRKARQ